MARLLVTGGAGFIGANFVHHWLTAHPGERVVVLDALTYAADLSSLEPLRERAELRFVHGDIGDTKLVEGLLRSEALDTIVHFAAESHVDRSIEGPEAFVRTNVIGTHSMLVAARRIWLEERVVAEHRFHHISTDEVYGSLGPDAAAFTEATPYAPNSPYSASKAASDHLVRAYHHTYGLCTTISNCSNNYGPRQFPEKLIPLMITQLLKGERLPVYGDGRHIRDWLHVADHCRAIELILARGRAGEVYNVGGGCERENVVLVRSLCRIIDMMFAASPELQKRFPRTPAAHGARSESLIDFVTDRPGHDRRYAIDCRKVQQECGYQARVSLDEGLRATIEWYLEHSGASK